LSGNLDVVELGVDSHANINSAISVHFRGTIRENKIGGCVIGHRNSNLPMALNASGLGVRKRNRFIGQIPISSERVGGSARACVDRGQPLMKVEESVDAWKGI
jgi:hypothetical protein